MNEPIFTLEPKKKKKGKEVSFPEAVNFSLSFLNKKMEDIPEEVISATISDINKISEIFTRKPEKVNLNII